MRKTWPLLTALVTLSACAGAPNAALSPPAPAALVPKGPHKGPEGSEPLRVPLPARLLAVEGEAGEPVIVAPVEDRKLALIVYHDDNSLVNDTRPVTLPAGLSTLRFPGVAPQIDGTSARLRLAEGAGSLTVKEQFFSSDLASSSRLLEKYVGKEIEVRLPAEGDRPSRLVVATLISVDGPVVRIGDKIYLKPPGEIILPAVPADLALVPTLQWRVQAAAAFVGSLVASYLTRGLSWQAEYVLTVDARERAGALEGWASITNQSGADFPDARLTVVAGTLHKAGGTPRPYPMYRYDAGGGGGDFTESPLSEFYRYDLVGRTTLGNNQTKQLSLLKVDTVPLDRRLRFDSQMGQLDETPRAAQLEYRFRNDAAHGLGRPLPQGRVRVYKGAALIGEDRLPNTPKDERVRIEVGQAFDVVGERKQTAALRPTEKVREETYTVTVRNHKPSAVDVEVVEHPYGTWVITKKSQSYTTVSANEIVFALALPAGGEATVTYSIRFTEP
jgi:hypothetical protein